jgi:hypothetical protein
VRCARRQLALVVSLIRAGFLDRDSIELIEADRHPYPFRDGRQNATR